MDRTSLFPIVEYPDTDTLKRYLKRPSTDAGASPAQVRAILDSVRERGDAAVKEYTLEFDGVALDSLWVPPDEIRQSAELVDGELKKAIIQASANIERFHAAQKQRFPVVETMPGIRCWKKQEAIQRVGLYVPGGSAPLFSSVLMLGIPARIAGCREIILATPPKKDGQENGRVDPRILYAAWTCGIERIYSAGGAQAIAALAYGTATLEPVAKIFGPGNSWVNTAKLLVQSEGTAIDMPAGPSEVLVTADESANPQYLAADLLSQAEHGADSQAILLATSRELLDQTREALFRQLRELPRRALAEGSLTHSFAVLAASREQMAQWSNLYAPEHLIVSLKEPGEFLEKIRNAGSVFLGNYSPESAGDYASGTNHTLPTGGFARAYSGITLGSFQKEISVQQLTPQGLSAIAQTIETMAGQEGLTAHKNAVSIRLKEPQAEPRRQPDAVPSPDTAPLAGSVPLPRANIQRLVPYSSARDEFEAENALFLDANENSLGSVLEHGYHRYPDPHQKSLKQQLAVLFKVAPDQLFLGNGSDEAIDLLIRGFCEPRQDSIIIQPPTYGMYEVAAQINDVRVMKVPLKRDFSVDSEALAEKLPLARLVFFCSPNNPSGNLMDPAVMLAVARDFPGLVIVDEAYIDFADSQGLLGAIQEYPNLVILRTFSKAWGLAGIRLGIAMAHPRIIAILDKIKYPYNLSALTQQAGLEALRYHKKMVEMRDRILVLKKEFLSALGNIGGVEEVFPSHANFVLARIRNAAGLYRYLKARNLAVRDRTRELYCENCLRITIGSPEENQKLLEAIQSFQTERREK